VGELVIEESGDVAVAVHMTDSGLAAPEASPSSQGSYACVGNGVRLARFAQGYTNLGGTLVVRVPAGLRLTCVLRVTVKPGWKESGLDRVGAFEVFVEIFDAGRIRVIIPSVAGNAGK